MSFTEKEVKEMIAIKISEVIGIKEKIALLQKQVRVAQKDLTLAETTLKVWKEVEVKLLT